jgi:hypothetical protein
MTASEARRRARELYIESHGQAEYSSIRTALRLEGHGDHTIDTIRKWRSRDIKAGHIKPDAVAEKFDKISNAASRVVDKLNIGHELSIVEKVEAARLADLEDTHERMLRVTNAAADRLCALIPAITITEIGEAARLAEIANSVAESSIKLRQALITVREATMKTLAQADGKSINGEIIPPTRPPNGSMLAALEAFQKPPGKR